MAGASILSAKSCLRAGVGKLTIHIPCANNDILQMSLPEAVLHHDISPRIWTSAPNDKSPAAYDAIGIGPGIGTDPLTAVALHALLEEVRGLSVPMVLDADALNILAQHPQWAGLLPPGTILTPHPLELRRLQQGGVRTDNVVLVGKGHPTVVYASGRPIYTCPYGGSGMATAGSGDVLTGIILGLLAQGYPDDEAAALGVCLHALSGDLATQDLGEHSVIASDLVEYLPKAFLNLQHKIINNE